MLLSKMIFSPLEQFKIIDLYKSVLGFSDDLYYVARATLNTFLTTNFVIYSMIIIILMMGIGVFLNKSEELIPQPPYIILEFLLKFVSDIMKQQASNSQPFLPFFFTIFIFILLSNLIALTPFSFSITSQIAVTWLIAFSCNFGFFCIGLGFHGFQFFKLFVPDGVPSLVMPLIVIIEVVSYILRTFSLSLRLFANIMAGHTLLHILIFFAYSFLNHQFYALTLIPFVLVFAICFLEFGIAFLQAYVFVVLLSIYLNDALHPAH